MQIRGQWGEGLGSDECHGNRHMGKRKRRIESGGQVGKNCMFTGHGYPHIKTMHDIAKGITTYFISARGKEGDSVKEWDRVIDRPGFVLQEGESS